jgi:hypothetical protein
MNYPYQPWGWGPPPQNEGPSRKELDRIAKNAVREALRLKGMDKNNKRKRREEARKQAAKTRQQFFTALEIFILGVLLHPFVGAAYNYAMHKVLP